MFNLKHLLKIYKMFTYSSLLFLGLKPIADLALLGDNSFTKGGGKSAKSSNWFVFLLRGISGVSLKIIFSDKESLVAVGDLGNFVLTCGKYISSLRCKLFFSDSSKKFYHHYVPQFSLKKT